jgi:hypothetical protein
MTSLKLRVLHIICRDFWQLVKENHNLNRGARYLEVISFLDTFKIQERNSTNVLVIAKILYRWKIDSGEFVGNDKRLEERQGTIQPVRVLVMAIEHFSWEKLLIPLPGLNIRFLSHAPYFHFLRPSCVIQLLNRLEAVERLLYLAAMRMTCLEISRDISLFAFYTY